VSHLQYGSRGANEHPGADDCRPSTIGMTAVSELLLVLDVGNTNTVVGLFRGSELVSRWRLSTHADRTADEVGMWLRQLLDWQRVDPAELVGVAVGSVVPPIAMTSCAPRPSRYERWEKYR